MRQIEKFSKRTILAMSPATRFFQALVMLVSYSRLTTDMSFVAAIRFTCNVADRRNKGSIEQQRPTFGVVINTVAVVRGSKPVQRTRNSNHSKPWRYDKRSAAIPLRILNGLAGTSTPRLT